MTQREINLHIAMERLRVSQSLLQQAEMLLAPELFGGNEKRRQLTEEFEKANACLSKIYVIARNEVGT